MGVQDQAGQVGSFLSEVNYVLENHSKVLWIFVGLIVYQGAYQLDGNHLHFIVVQAWILKLPDGWNFS